MAQGDSLTLAVILVALGVGLWLAVRWLLRHAPVHAAAPVTAAGMLEISQGERALRNGHHPGIILFTGERGTGKARLARHLERRLFNSGRQVYLLDGINLRFGLGHDLMGKGRGRSTSRVEGEEMVRRFGEVAQILMRAGQIVVSTTNTFAQADHQIIRTLVHPYPVISVHMAFAHDELPDNTDLAFLESDDLRAAARRIVDAMEERGVLL